MRSSDLIDELKKHASDSDAVFLQRFFKSGPGEYGAGDQFIGVRVPVTRKLAKRFKNLDLSEVRKLINSPIHEHRLAGLIILTLKYPQADPEQKDKIFDLYIDSLKRGKINNWDLVDVTCHLIVGPHVTSDRRLLYELARSHDLWQKRVAVISSFHYIKQGEAVTTIDLAEILLRDSHDLIHKAVGWMLREVGKRVDERVLIAFLDKHAHEMPRTMLRYSIERLTAAKKTYYMAAKSV